MTTYREIANSEVSENAPITALLVSALRDNALAIAEGDDTAPKIQGEALESAAATWSTPSRSAETSYRNTTGEAIQVIIGIFNSASFTTRLEASNDGSAWVALASTGASSTNPNFVTANINPGHYYRITAVSGANYSSWAELRP